MAPTVFRFLAPAIIRVIWSLWDASGSASGTICGLPALFVWLAGLLFVALAEWRPASIIGNGVRTRAFEVV